MKRENWIWMPHPAHFICASRCRFHLATYVGKYIVSTVGEMYSDRSVRDILYKYGLKENEYEDIGWNRKYETMVFRARKQVEKNAECCPWSIIVSKEVDMQGYNTAKDAYAGHMAMCRKWAK